jgi:hypothetical protein
MDYKKRIDSQINQYKNVEDMHSDVPAINNYYKSKFVSTKVSSIFDIKNHIQFYYKYLNESINKTGNPNLVSIGSGDGSIEVEVGKLFSRTGDKFRFTLLELSSIQIDRAISKVNKAGLEKNFNFVQTDLNSWGPKEKYAGIMAHHSLHHVVNLEHLFDGIKNSLEGKFCSMDMIGRNGHMRWPETLALVNKFWNIIPLEKRKHRTLPGFERTFYNHDCSTVGFEGIRAQDILSCLVKRFRFERFFAFGGLIDPFVSRGFGHNYNINSDWDKSLIDLIANLDDILIDCGYIKPTQMFAVMTNTLEQKTKIYRNRTPEFCIRPPDMC